MKLAALKATSTFVLNNNEDKAIVKMFAETVLPMLQILNVLIEKDEDDALLSFIELAEKCPQLLRSNFNTLMEICMKAIGNPDLSDKIKFSALEIIVSYAETAPQTVRKRGTNYLVPLGMCITTPVLQFPVLNFHSTAPFPSTSYTIIAHDD